MEKEGQLSSQADELEQLKQKLAKMEEEHAEEKQMAQWCRENVEQTKDGTLKLKTPNIIGNMEDVQQPFSSGN